MTNFNFLSKSGGQSMGHSSVTLASTVGSPSAHRRSVMLKPLFFALFFLLCGTGNAWADYSPGTGYTLVTDISALSTNDKVILFCIQNGEGISGQNNKDASASNDSKDWIEFKVTKSTASFTLKDEGANKYIQEPTGNEYYYNSTTGGACTVSNTGLLTCNDRYLFKNGSYYRFYGTGSSYTNKFYVYKVTSSTPCSVSWVVNGSPYSVGNPTNSVNSGNKVTQLPTAPGSALCDGTKVFAGWSTSEITGTTNTRPTTLFSTAAKAPIITGDVTYYAVFANQVSSGGTTVTLFDVTSYNSIPSGWSQSGIGTGSYFGFDTNGEYLTSALYDPHDNVQVTCSVACLGSGTNHNLTVYLLDKDGVTKDTKTTSTPTNSSTYLGNSFDFGDVNYSFKIKFYLKDAGKGIRLQKPKCTGTTLPTYNGYCTSCCTPLGQINGSVF